MRTLLTCTALLLSCSAATALAASSGPSSTVVYVAGNDLVIKASDGSILNYMVPAGYKFTAAGKAVTIDALKPGTQLTAPIATGADPQVVGSIAVAKAKVYSVAPPDSVTLIMSDGSKEFTLPAGESFMVDGKPVALSALKPDTMVDVTAIMPVADGAAAGPAPATPPMSGTLLVAKSEDLPSAGTKLPLYLLIGMVMMLTGAAMMVRRPTSQLARNRSRR